MLGNDFLLPTRLYSVTMWMIIGSQHHRTPWSLLLLQQAHHGNRYGVRHALLVLRHEMYAARPQLDHMVPRL